jgi:hypothetical protein
MVRPSVGMLFTVLEVVVPLLNEMSDEPGVLPAAKM